MPKLSESASAATPDWQELTQTPFDLLVVGGGIVGAGVARDAAQRGLRTLLVDQRDFASGTSSRSSRLLHGGIRYLAQGRVGLVWEASREKNAVARIAPHLSAPLAFIFPTRRRTPWKRWKLSIGVWLYDLLCGIRFLGRSKSLTRAGISKLLPGLSTTDLTGGVRYFDALTNDSRLVLDTLRSAEREGAIVRNYVGLTDAVRKKDRWFCQLDDRRDGSRHSVEARAVVNATGPWSDQLPNSKTKLRVTKGVHLVVDARRLNVPDAVVVADGERILFVIPWGDRVILGTTDTDYQGSLDEPPCDREDVAYVLKHVNGSFPGADLQETDVISVWSGVRPLVASASGKPSDISRRHEITMSNPAWWDVTGGKLTTYRAMAEETVDEIVDHLDVKAPACRTGTTPLLTAEELAWGSGLLPPPVSMELVRHYCREEWARNLDDVMIRRTSWRHYYRNHLDIAREAARWMAEELGWNQQQTDEQLARYRELTGAAEAAGPRLAPSGATAT
jgi:glycerol-3-phosphate dehydrogenase